MVVSAQALAEPPEFLNVEGKQFEVGQVVQFSNDIFSVGCFSILAADGSVVSWIYEWHEIGEATLVRRCIDNQHNPYVTLQSGKYGDTRVEWEILGLSKGAESLEFQVIEIPGHGYFSSLSFCQKKAAYWVEEAGSWSVRVYDLASKEILVTEAISNDPIETDNPGYFERPTWSASCTEAIVTGHPPIPVGK